MTISNVGATWGSPDAGDSILLVLSIEALASCTANLDNGTCAAIWSPSKSALNAVHTKGCNCIAFPSINMGMKAWMPNRCNVGARFSITGLSLITSSKMSHTSGRARSTILLALLMFGDTPRSTSLCITNGLNNSKAIFFGNPHWSIRSSGPTTITDLPE